MRHTAQFLLILALLLASVGCHRSSSGSSESNSLFTDASLVYSPDYLIFTIGLDEGPFIPEFTAGNNSVGFPSAYEDLNFGVSPDLPEGIGFDPTDGSISGTASNTSLLISHTVTAYDGIEDLVSTEITLRVINDGPPSDLSYDYTEATFSLGSFIEPDHATVTGDVTEWSITPGLPTILSISQLDGTISGRLRESFPETEFVVTASNPHGSTQATLRFATGGELRSVWVGGDGIVVHEHSDHIGGLIPLTVRSGDFISDMVAMPDSERVYVAEYLEGRIVAYSVDPADQLPDGGTVAADLPGVISLAVVASGTRLLALVDNGMIVAFAIDPASGDLTTESAIAAPSPSIGDAIVTNPVSDLVYVPSTYSLAVYQSAPDLEYVHEIVMPDFTHDLVLDGTGRFAYALLADNTIAQYQVSTPEEIAAGSLALTPLATPIFDPDVSVLRDSATQGEQFYLLTSFPGLVIEYTIDTTTGELSSSTRAPVSVGLSPFKIEVAGGHHRGVIVLGDELLWSLLTGAEEQLYVHSTNMVRGAAFHLLTLKGPQNEILGPTRWVFSTHHETSTVRVYSYGAHGLFLEGEVATAEGPTGVVLDERNEHCYVPCETAGVVQVFDFDNVTGSMTLASLVEPGESPTQIVLDRSGRFAYVLDRETTLHGLQSYSIEADGALTPLANHGVANYALGITIDPLGSNLYLFSSLLGLVKWWGIDLTSGHLIPQSPQVGFEDIAGVPAFAPSGRFAYFAAPSAGELRTYTRGQDGRFTWLQTISAGTGTSGLAIHPVGSYIYAINPGSNDISAYIVNRESGLATEVSKSPFPTTGVPTSAAVASAARIVDPFRLLVGTSGAETGIASFHYRGSDEYIFTPMNTAPDALTANVALSD